MALRPRRQDHRVTRTDRGARAPASASPAVPNLTTPDACHLAGQGEDESDTRVRQRLARRAAVHAARTAGRLAGSDGAAQPKAESSDRLRAQLRIACCAHALSHNELVTVLE